VSLTAETERIAPEPERGLLRSLPSPARGFLRSAVAVAAGLLVSFAVIAAVSEQPLVALAALTLGSFGDRFSFGSMLSIATVLMMTGLSAGVAFRSGAFNIGGEGQLYVGALASAVVALYTLLPGPAVIGLALVAGAAAGALWVVVPALLRAFAGVNEIVTTLMANYIATLVTLYLVNGPLRNPRSGAPETARLTPDVELPGLLTPSKASWGLFGALAFVALFQVLSARTRLGLRARLVGLRPLFAETVGIAPARVLVGALLTSGALAGLAGALVTLGIEHRFIQGFSPGYGFLGVTVALIGRLSPVGIAAAALLYGALLNGATEMQSASDVPFALVFLLQGILILLITAQGLRIGRAA
jgi:simple sugar transport system permease protein